MEAKEKEAALVKAEEALLQKLDNSTNVLDAFCREAKIPVPDVSINVGEYLRRFEFENRADREKFIQYCLVFLPEQLHLGRLGFSTYNYGDKPALYEGRGNSLMLLTDAIRKDKQQALNLVAAARPDVEKKVAERLKQFEEMDKKVAEAEEKPQKKM